MTASKTPQSVFLRKHPNVALSSLHDACDQEIVRLERELSTAEAAGYARAVEDAIKECYRLACPDAHMIPPRKESWRAAPGSEYYDKAAQAIRALIPKEPK